MDAHVMKRGLDALRAYVSGESSEPMVLSAFRTIPLEERNALVTSHRAELAVIDPGRLLIAESILLPLAHRRG